jgi:hypothetical protein
MMTIVLMMIVKYCSGMMIMMKIMMIIMKLNYRSGPVLGQPGNYSKHINFFSRDGQ